MKANNLTSKAVKKTTQPSPAKLTQEVKEKAFSLGAHLVGIAPISRMKNAPPELNPKRLLPEAKSLISMAYRINRVRIDFPGTEQPAGLLHTTPVPNAMWFAIPRN